MSGPHAKLGSLLAALCSAALLACNQGKPCGDPGRSHACTCRDGRAGTEQCLPERVLGDCKCSVTMQPSDAGHDAGAIAKDSGATTQGSGSGGSASAPKPDASSTLASTDDDSGAGSPAKGSGGTGGGGGMTGAGGMTGGGGGAGAGAGGGGGSAGGAMSLAYAACASAGDCRPGSDCTMVAADTLLGTPDGSVCAPPCTTASDCPVPEGSYQATVVCDIDQLCRLDCTPLDVSSSDLSCPTGMTCIANQLTTSLCFH